MNEAELRFIAIKLELLVMENPYMYVPETGKLAGALGLNYYNIIKSVLELKIKKEQK